MINTADIQLNLRASLLKMCNDFIFDNTLTDFENFDFDAHAGIQDLPNTHLIGISELSLTEDKELYYGECMAMICTKQDDTNLKNLYPVNSKLFDALRADKSYPLVDSSNGQTIGRIVVKLGTTSLPVAFTKSRPLQVIAFSFGVVLNQTP